MAVVDLTRAEARLVAPISEDREPPIQIHAYLPLTAQLTLWDDWLPGAVELGATLIHPVAYARSEYEAGKTQGRRERWERIIKAAAEQSHRNRVPELGAPMDFEALLKVEAPQKWVAYELPVGEANPVLRKELLAFTHGPEGGLTDPEYKALRAHGWVPVTLGKSILRAATCPAAILGAIQFELGR